MGQEVPISNAFRGLNRSVAPHLIPEAESPDTVDCAHGSDQLGLLGPRKGRERKYTHDYRLLGVRPFNLPGQRFRIVADTNGEWDAIAVPWPAAPTPLPLNGWVRVNITTLTASQAGVGANNGAAKALNNPQNMEDFGAIQLGDTDTYTDDLDVTVTGTVDDGTITLQGKIDGVWTDLFTWQYTTGGIALNQQYTTGTGELTDVRLVSTVTTGTGTLAATLNAGLYLIYGTERETVAVS